MQILFRTVVLAVFALSAPATALAEWTIEDAVNAVIEDAIKPAFSRYHLQAMAMSASMDVAAVSSAAKGAR